MSETFIPLFAATILFVGGHFLLSSRPLRPALVARLGQWGFTGLYSAMSLAAFIWMCVTYARAPILELWPGEEYTWWVAAVAVLAASILLVCGYLTANPTALFGGRVLARDDPAPGIFKVTRHPVLWAVALWSGAHLIANGDASSLIFFGGLLALSLGGAAHIDARKAAEDSERWRKLAAATSFVPFAAALQGRTRIDPAEIGWLRIALAVALYLAVMQAHVWLVGIPIAPWTASWAL
jgi:uncharacterized membrane protein